MDKKDNQYFVVEKIKAGNTEAFRQLFRMYYPSVLAFVNGFVKSTEASEDIAQDVFMKIWIYRSSLDPSKPVRNYLFLLARRQICNWFRKEVAVQKYVSDISAEELESLIATYGDQDSGELKKIADEVISEMPEKRRLVFVLSRGEGLTAQEIAQRLGISARTVNKHMQLALRTLRNRLSNRDYE